MSMYQSALDRQTRSEAFINVIPIAQESRAIAHGKTPESAFKEVLPKAQESSPEYSSLIGVQNYTRIGNGNGNATNTGNTFYTMSTMTDLYIEVELIARRILSPEQFNYFRSVYLVEMISVEEDATAMTFDRFVEERYAFDGAQDVVRAYDQEIRELLGAAFIELGLSPLKKYFFREDVRLKYERAGRVFKGNPKRSF